MAPAPQQLRARGALLPGAPLGARRAERRRGGDRGVAASAAAECGATPGDYGVGSGNLVIFWMFVEDFWSLFVHVSIFDLFSCVLIGFHMS